MRQSQDVGFGHAGHFAPPGEAPGMQVVCIGGACVDRAYHAQGKLELGSSNPALRGDMCFGGVARNVAENLARLGASVALVSVIGSDPLGAAMRDELQAARVDVGLVKTAAGASDEYLAILERGELALGLADMRNAESFSRSDLDRVWERVARAAWLFVDCNVPAEILQTCIDRRSIGHYRLAVDAVSAPKARKLPPDLRPIDVLFINEGEARAYLADAAGLDDDAELLARRLLGRGAQAVVLARAERGVICAGQDWVVPIPAVPARRVSATGAGDALIAGTLWRLGDGDDLIQAVRVGVKLAAQTLGTERSVLADLSP